VSLDLSPDPQRVMAALISVRPDDSVQATLEAEARTRGIDLTTFLRQLATEAARELPRNAIQAQSAAVARHIAENPGAQDFADFWGTPRAACL
jgi:hypothetical protein